MESPHQLIKETGREPLPPHSRLQTAPRSSWMNPRGFSHPAGRSRCPPAPPVLPVRWGRTWSEVQVLMTLVSYAVLLSLTSSGSAGLFSVFGSTVTAGLGFLGATFTSVPFPKAWMAFPARGMDLGRMDVGKDQDLTRKSHRYLCITKRSLNVESEGGIEMKGSFDIKEKNC